MASHLVTGPLRGYVSGIITFMTLEDMTSAGSLLPADTVYTVTPAPDGQFGINLPVPDVGGADYSVMLADGSARAFNLSSISSHHIGDLLAEYEAGVTRPSMGPPGPAGPAGVDFTGGGIESFWYADSASRASATDVTSDDSGKIAYQADEMSYWRLLGFLTPQSTDDFNRADVSPLDNAVTGEAWEAVITDGWQIVSNQACLISGGSTSGAVVDSGVADGEVAVTVAQNYGYGDGIMFRYQNTTNYFVFVNTGDGYYSCKRVLAGVETVLGSSTGITPAHGDVLRVHMEGVTLTCYVNDAVAWTGTNTALQTATKHGMITRGALARFDDFSVVALGSVPDWLKIIVPIAQLIDSASGMHVGDILYTADATTGRVQRLPIGSAGQLLSVVDGVPAWVDPPA